MDLHTSSKNREAEEEEEEEGEKMTAGEEKGKR